MQVKREAPDVFELSAIVLVEAEPVKPSAKASAVDDDVELPVTSNSDVFTSILTEIVESKPMAASG